MAYPVRRSETERAEGEKVEEGQGMKMEQILKIRWTREQPKKPGLYWFSPDGLPHQKRVEMELLGYDKDGKLHKLGESPDWGPDTRYSFDPGFWAPVEYPKPPDKQPEPVD